MANMQRRMFCFVRQYCFSIASFFHRKPTLSQSEAVTVSFPVAVDFRKTELPFPAIPEHLGCISLSAEV